MFDPFPCHHPARSCLKWPMMAFGHCVSAANCNPVVGPCLSFRVWYYTHTSPEIFMAFPGQWTKKEHRHKGDKRCFNFIERIWKVCFKFCSHTLNDKYRRFTEAGSFCWFRIGNMIWLPVLLPSLHLHGRKWWHLRIQLLANQLH